MAENRPRRRRAEAVTEAAARFRIMARAFGGRDWG